MTLITLLIAAALVYTLKILLWTVVIGAGILIFLRLFSGVLDAKD